MRLIQTRNRHQRRGRPPRIAISQAEITADLEYRGGTVHTREAAPVKRGRR
jgi:hypothetical protein